MARKAHKKQNDAQDPSWAEMIGGTLAFAQDTVDSVVGWGFQKLKESADRPRKKAPQRHPTVDGAAQAARAAASFIGEVGSSFYATYEALKEEKRRKNRGTRSTKRPK